jgi:hypothetical protein
MPGFEPVAGLSLTQQTMDMMKGSLGSPTDRFGNNLTKGVSISTGLTWYDLAAPAKMLYPIITPLRNAIPRTMKKTPGNAAHWKQIMALQGSGFDAMGWVPEGQRSGTMSYQSNDMAATYVTLGEEDYLTFEAEAAAEGLEDENAMVTFRLLQKMMRKEEMGILGGNATLSLSPPGTLTPSVAGSTGTLPTATYSIYVVALTLEGWKNSSITYGIATTKVITGADGKNYTLYGGSSNKSSNATQAVTLGQILTCVCTPVQGAMAYGWFIGTAGNETLQAITNISAVNISAPLTAGTQAISAITQNCSRNPGLAFDGLLTCALNPNAPFFVNATAAQAYVNILPNNGSTGTGLTASGRGSVNEIDQMLITMWNTYNIGPDVIYVNSQEQKNITNKVLSNTSGPLLRYDTPATGSQAYGIVAGGVVEYYYNPFTMGGGTKIPVLLHPDVPPGTIIAWCSQLPTWYQSNEVPNVAEMLLRRDYYRIDWPLRTRQREYGVYAEEVLAVYATFAMGVITNIANI